MVFKNFFKLNLLVSLFFFFMPLWAWDDEDEEEKYYDTCTLIYDGLRIECDAGCGSSDYDPDLKEINTLFTAHVKKLNEDAYECNYISGFYDEWQDKIWKQEDPHRYSVFCLATQNHSFDLTTVQYDHFLETKAQFLTDFYFYNRKILTHKKNYLKQQQQNLLLLKQFKERGYGFISQEENEEGFNVPVPTSSISRNAWDIDSAIQQCEQAIASTPEKILRKKEEFARSSVEIQESLEKIDQLFKKMFVWCLEHHQPEGVSFNLALESLLMDEIDCALDHLRILIDSFEQRGFGDQLLAKLHFLKGSVQSECGLYADAILALTTAIQKDPSLKEAYFERATAYFELGQFDRAIEDFRSSGFRSHKIESNSALAAGIALGIVKGTSLSAVDFAPSLLATLRGLGTGLWAFSKDPIGASQEFVDAAVLCIKYIKERSILEIAQEIAPELKELLQNYDQLPDFEKGTSIGLLIGKYGTDLFLGNQSVKMIKAYRNLRKANQLMTLEALASPEKTQTILVEASKRWALRKEVLAKANLKINLDKQGKHLEGHKNYKRLLEQDQHPSIFEHPDPERLLRDYAGTGIKEGQALAGTPGYKEVINFEEVIGYAINEFTGEKTITTWGKIHYSKDGVHIVPKLPQGAP